MRPLNSSGKERPGIQRNLHDRARGPFIRLLSREVESFRADWRGYRLRIAIAGAGMAGAYLQCLLKEEGHTSVELFDVRRSNACGHKPCAWGVAPYSEYERLVSRFEDPSGYVLARCDKISIDGVEMKADLATIDKPRLLKDLIGDTRVRLDPLVVDDFDRVIDATGCERAFLGPATGPELIAQCGQYRIRTTEEMGLWFRTKGLGYEWCFPLGDDIYHMGFGNLDEGAEEYRPQAEDAPALKGKVLCKCLSRIRLTSPYYSQPFSVGERIIGVGESIGTVGPLGGDGNLYAMQCAELLLRHWDDPEAYTAAVLKKYSWMRKEREALEKLLRGKVPPITDIRVFTNHSKRVGIEMGPVQALRLFKTVVETSRERRHSGEIL